MRDIAAKEISSMDSRYRPEIDGLRAFAVLSVIINHFNKEILPGGYLGVDIFFVISGFVITSSLYQRPYKNFKDFISGFYERRIKRLLPALLFFVLITSTIICLFNPNPEKSLITGITSLFGLSNIYLLYLSTDYFAQSTELNVFTHTWSLGIEEQFYILFPFLIWFSGFGRETNNSLRNLLLIIGTLTVGSFIGFLYLYPSRPAAYFFMPTRFWEISTGCLLFLGLQKRKNLKQSLEKVPPLLTLALMVGVMYLPINFAAESTIAVVTMSAVLIAALKKGTKVYVFFTHPKVIYIGLISYSLYLWHWGVLAISRWTIGIHWWTFPIQVFLILGLSITSYKYIETPIRKDNLFIKKWKIFLIGGGMLFALSSFLITLLIPLQGKLYTGKSTKAKIKSIGLTEKMINNNDCHADESYDTEQLSLLFKECKYPLIRKSRNQSTIAFLGDSHAQSLLKAEEILANKGFRLVHYSHSGCPFPAPPYGINPLECNNFLINAEKEIFQDLKQGDSIVIYNYHLSHLGSQNLKDTRHKIFNRFKYLVSHSPTKIDLYMKGLSRLSKKASEESISIYLIGNAYRNNDISLTKEWFRPQNPALKTLIEETSNAKKLNQTLSDKIKFLKLTNVIFLDPLKIIDESCGKNINSYLTCFIDGNHMSNKVSKELLDYLMKKHLIPSKKQNIS